jgi:hypothetical protein
MKTQTIPMSAQVKIVEAESLILDVLEHISAGRFNEEVIKGKLIQACKNLPILNDSRLIKYC